MIKQIILGLLLSAITSTSLMAAQQYFMSEEPARVDCSNGKEIYSLTPQSSKVNALITNDIAQIVYEQTYYNNSEDTLEASYVFPMPHKASVNGMSYLLDSIVHVAEIMEKQKAIDTYDSLKNSGENVGLLLQNKPNIFEQRISRIPAKDSVKVYITLTLPLEYDNGEFEFVFPTYIAPRFGSNSYNYTSGSDWNPPDSVSKGQIDFNIVLQTDFEVTGISSPTHPIMASVVSEALKNRITKSDLSCDFQKGITIVSKNSYMNSDFIFRYSRKELADAAFNIVKYYDKANDCGYFYASMYPDETIDAESQISRNDYMFLIDISGSQSGWPLEKQKEIALEVLSRLNDNDNICVSAFEEDIYYMNGNKKFIQATKANIAKAEEFIANLSTGGGTYLYAALNEVLSIKGERNRVYLLFTDGFIDNEEAIMERIINEGDITLFTFGSGNGLNHFFLDKAAEVGNGFSVALTEDEDAATAVNDAWEKISSPQIENIVITCSDSADIIVKSNRLFQGRMLYFSGKVIHPSGVSELTLHCSKSGFPISMSRTINFKDEKNSSWVIPKIWAKDKIYNLEIYQPEKTAEIISISTEHQVLSSLTAFITLQSFNISETEALDDYFSMSPSSTSIMEDNGKSDRSFAISGYSVVIGPNPVSLCNKVFVAIDKEVKEIELELRDDNGKLLCIKKFKDIHELEIELEEINNLESGVYYIVLKVDGHIKALQEFYKK